MDINLLLNQLIFQYNIDKHMPKYRLYVKAKDIAKDVVKELSEKYNKIILVGSKNTDIKWFKSSICRDEVIEFCINTKEKVEIPEEYLNDGNCFINVSFYEREWVKDYFGEKQVLVYDLYDVFEKNGLFFLDNFYDVYQCEYYDYNTGRPSHDMFDFDINYIFFRHRGEYEKEKNNESKRKKLEVLIFDLVYAKDFLLLKEYIGIYKEQYDLQYSKEYIDFYHEVEKLLQDIKMKLQSRKQKDCIMLWLDALGYERAGTMKFFNDIQEESISFEKIFTVSPYTSATFKTLFAKSRIVEEEAYKITRVNKSNSKLIRDLEMRNYEFRYYGCLEVAEELDLLHYHVRFSTMTELYWDALGDILLSEQQCFCMLHELFHTHNPFVSMELQGEDYFFKNNSDIWQERDIKVRNRQEKDSKEYVDKQLKFWSELLPEHMYKIYMSDHGLEFMKNFHVFMKIQQKDIIPIQCKKVVSYYDFDKIILQVLDEHCVREDDLSKGCAIIQDVPVYNKDDISIFLNRKDFSADGMSGFQGIVTENDMFIRYNDGVEYYQKFVNDEEMVSDQRLEQLRNMISKKEINIEIEEKFQYSRIVWNAYRKCKERTKETEENKLKIIKNIFSNIPSDGVLAIRGGGMHTIRLLMLLEEELRRKVRYIVDADSGCFAGKMGIKVISQEEMKDYHIDFLLLSSYQYKDVWKEELSSFSDIKIIDMYDIFEENGIYCNREFYHLTYEKEDFEG